MFKLLDQECQLQSNMSKSYKRNKWTTTNVHGKFYKTTNLWGSWTSIFLRNSAHATQASCPNHTPHTRHIKTRKHLAQHNTTKPHHPLNPTSKPSVNIIQIVIYILATLNTNNKITKKLWSHLAKPNQCLIPIIQNNLLPQPSHNFL